MLYRLNDEFTKIDQNEGLMQNMTRHSEIEVVACMGNPEKDSGILLLPMEKLKFTAKMDDHIYARCAKVDGTIATVSVVNFKMPAQGEPGVGCNCKSEIDDAVTALDKSWSSKKISETFTKYYTKEEVDGLIENGGTGGTPGNYVQVTKNNVKAPKLYNLPIAETKTFNLPPAEVLKFKKGDSGKIVTVYEFDNADATDFTVDGINGEVAKYIEFDGVMKPRTEFEFQVSDPVPLENGYISESEEINFADYKKVTEVW